MRSVRARRWAVKVTHDGGLSQKERAKNSKMLPTQPSSAWTKSGGEAGNLESELARANYLTNQYEATKLALRESDALRESEYRRFSQNKLNSQLEAIKLKQRESENRVKQFFTSNEIGGGIVATEDFQKLLLATQDKVLSPPISLESKTGDDGSEDDDDVEVQKAADLAAQTAKMLSMATATKEFAEEKLLLARQNQSERKFRKGDLRNFCLVLATPNNVHTMFREARVAAPKKKKLGWPHERHHGGFGGCHGQQRRTCRHWTGVAAWRGDRQRGSDL